MAHYDEQILVKAAAKFNVEASMIIYVTALRYLSIVGVIAWLACVVFIRISNSPDVPSPNIVAGVCAAVAMFIGIFVGRKRAFELRLRAQQLLALIEIEHHTRTSEMLTTGAH